MVNTKKQDSDIKIITKEVVESCLKDNTFLELLAEKITTAVSQKLEAKFEIMYGKCEVMESKMKALELEKDELINKIDNLEMYGRRSNIRVFGIQEQDNEDCCKLLQTHLYGKLGIELHPNAIDRCHRVGPIRQAGRGGPTRPRAIIVKFTRTCFRNEVISRKKILKNTGVVVYEDLTKNKMDLLKEAGQAFGSRNVWSKEGVIWIAKDNTRHRITTMDALRKLQQQCN